MTFPAELVPELGWHLERFAQPGARGLVFAGPTGATLRRSNFRPIWNAACDRAGIPGLHFHDLSVATPETRGRDAGRSYRGEP